MKRILLVFGTRPEAIKMAPVYRELQKYPDVFEPIICVTGQHRQMLDQVLDVFDIVPEYDLHSNASRTSSTKALAVMAMIGIVLAMG